MVKRNSSGEWLKKWKEARDSVNQGPTVPVGSNYKMLLKKGIVKPIKEKETATFVWDVLEGEYQGKEHRAVYWIGTAYGLGLLAQDLEKLNFPTEDFAKKEDLIETIEGIGDEKIHALVSVTANTNPDYANWPKTTIESLLEGEEGDADVVDADVVEPPNEDVAEAETEPEATTEEVEPEAEAEPEPEDDAPEDAADDVVDVGDTVRFEYKKKQYKGIIKNISEELDDKDRATFKISSGGMLYTIKQDKVLDKVDE